MKQTWRTFHTFKDDEGRSYEEDKCRITKQTLLHLEHEGYFTRISVYLPMFCQEHWGQNSNTMTEDLFKKSVIDLKEYMCKLIDDTLLEKPVESDI